MTETPKQFAARFGLEPPADPEGAAQWWREVAGLMGDQWPENLPRRPRKDAPALVINRIR